jgi:hypothetical protein
MRTQTLKGFYNLGRHITATGQRMRAPPDPASSGCLEASPLRIAEQTCHACEAVCSALDFVIGRDQSWWALEHCLQSVVSVNNDRTHSTANSGARRGVPLLGSETAGIAEHAYHASKQCRAHTLLHMACQRAIILR